MNLLMACKLAFVLYSEAATDEYNTGDNYATDNGNEVFVLFISVKILLLWSIMVMIRVIINAILDNNYCY